MAITIENLIAGTEQLIANSDGSEYSLRTICNKTYYALFHATLIYLNIAHNYNEIIDKGAYSYMGTHEKLTTFLEDHIHIPKINTNKKYHLLVTILLASKKLRVDSDYFLDKHITEIELRQAKNQFTRALNILKELQQELPK